MSPAWTGENGGVEWRLELDRIDLIPGRLVDGRVTCTARHRVEARALVVALRADEHWKHRVTHTDGEGHTTTSVHTEHDELVVEPVQVEAPVALEAGETRTWPFQLPVPPDGPASLDADVAGLDWTVEAKLDIDGAFDSSLEIDARVVQPVALLRAGAVPVGEFALYGSADAVGDGARAAISLDPVPLCSGEPFTGTLVLEPSAAQSLQEIRAEIRVKVQATVPQGLEETITTWAAILAPGGEISGRTEIPFSGTLAPAALPTVELPHARTSAEFHVILATAWAPDPHLVRDVAIATTLEL